MSHPTYHHREEDKVKPTQKEASQVIGPSTTAKIEKIYQMDRNMEDKIKKLDGDALTPELVVQIVDFFNRTMDEMMKEQVDSYRAIHRQLQERRRSRRSSVDPSLYITLISGLLDSVQWTL